MEFIHVSIKVERRIENLEHSGKAGKTLAQKVTRIIENFTAGAAAHHTDVIGSTTKYGEKRIRNCLKYDLGCGYRLITLQRGAKVYMPFLGTHDECQRWLENNSRLKAVAAGKGTWFRIPRNHPFHESPADAGSADPEDERLQKISDKDLRRVFCGLVQGARKRQRKTREHLERRT